ncbi:AsmA-like C-terminal domain-containing protein [Campylobacter sp. VTCC 70190]|uniref:YhdP family protein n=1 Tax=Campylobacter sp. VTCC 70190 TaxID=3392118 RepID=UPI00398EA076
MKKKILFISLFFAVLILALFIVLKNGIVISSIQFDFFKLEQLYIKLDKKLIVRAKNIVISKSDSTAQIQSPDSASAELLKITKNLKYLYALVEELDIQNLNIKDNHVRILFKDNEFFIDNDLLFLVLNLQRQKEDIKADIKKLLLKDYNLSVDGSLNIDTKSEFYYFQGRARGKLLEFNANIFYKDKILAYEFENINIRDITELITKIDARFELPQSLKFWLTSGARGEFYHLDFLKGLSDFSKNNFLEDISALGFVNKVQVRLDDKMNAIFIPKLDLNLSKQKLDFAFTKASYKGADLSASKVYLYDLFDPKKAGIYLRLKASNLQFDERLAKALENYHFSLPFYQKSGKLGSDLELKIDFHERGKISYGGTLALENANLSLANLNVIKAFVKLNQNDLSIENASVKNGFLEANFNARLDLQKQQGQFDTQISRLYFDNGELLDLRNQKIAVNLDYSKEPSISVPQWDLSLNFKDGLEANLNSPKLLFAYSPLLKKLGFINAKNVYYKTLDFGDFNASITDASFKNKLFLKNQSPYEKDSFSITRNKDYTQIYTQSDLISAKISPNNKEIHLKNLNYVYEKDTNSSKSLPFDISTNTQNISLGGANVALVLKDMNKTLAFDRVEADLKASVLNLKGSRGNALFNLAYSVDDLNLSVKADDEYLNEFLQKQAVRYGEFYLNLKGSGVEYFDGVIDFKNTYAKDLKGLNQLISFIDTVPSLLMFKSPTFNQKGLSLHDGKIIFNRKKDLLSVSAINLNGDSVDIYGLGSANLRLNTLDFNLELKTLKSASEAISKVPILNYVILGKNQEISTNIKVDGSIDEPKFHTEILSDTLKTPFNLIKNIIQLPANLLN